MLIRVSIGSAIKLGLLPGKLDEEPTTLYTMTCIPNRCAANCAFCAQASSSKSSLNRLSRVSWPIFPVDQLIKKLEKVNPFKRLCIQALNYQGVHNDLMKLVELFKNQNLPISLSCQPLTESSMKKFAEKGVDRLAISLDAASQTIFEKMKGKGVHGPYRWNQHFVNLANAVKVFGEGEVTTHLIVGLGETDKELLTSIDQLVKIGVIPSLFSFTPIPGTKLEKRTSPLTGRYRALQLICYLIQNQKVTVEDISWNDKNKLVDINKDEIRWEKIVFAHPEMFQTQGCPDCNRPFYNERPLGPTYNYPRKPSSREVIEAIKDIKNYIK